MAGPVYRACAVTTKAVMITKDVRPDFHPSTSGNSGKHCYSVELDYVVNANGLIEVETARIVTTNNQEYAQSVVVILPQLRFAPAQLDGAPVRQIVMDKLALSTARVMVTEGSGRPSPPRMPRC